MTRAEQRRIKYQMLKEAGFNCKQATRLKSFNMNAVEFCCTVKREESINVQRRIFNHLGITL